MSIKIVIDVNRIKGAKVTTIYQIDAMAEMALRKGEDTIHIMEPSMDVLNQLNQKRDNYELVFAI